MGKIGESRADYLTPELVAACALAPAPPPPCRQSSSIACRNKCVKVALGISDMQLIYVVEGSDVAPPRRRQVELAGEAAGEPVTKEVACGRGANYKCFKDWGGRCTH